MRYTEARQIIMEAAIALKGGNTNMPIKGVNPKPKPDVRPTLANRKSQLKYAQIAHDMKRKISEASNAKSAIDRLNAVNADIDSGKETARMLKQIKSNHADAKRMAGAEASKARAATNPVRRLHHEMRADHFNTHVRNYEKHHGNAKKHHDSGNYRKAYAEGSSAASPRHMRDIPSHVDIHNH